MKKISNTAIYSVAGKYDAVGETKLRIPEKYNAGEKTVWQDANTFRALRHLAVLSPNVPAVSGDGSGPNPFRQNTFDDTLQAQKLLESLERDPNGDEDAPFIFLDDAVHGWAVKAIKERIGIFNANAPKVLEVVETVVKDEPAASDKPASDKVTPLKKKVGG